MKKEFSNKMCPVCGSTDTEKFTYIKETWTGHSDYIRFNCPDCSNTFNY